MRTKLGLPAEAGDTVFMGMGPLSHPAQMYRGAALLLDGEAPDPAEVAAHIDARLPDVPGLCHRYVRSAWRPYWQPCQVRAVDHVARHIVTGDGTQGLPALIASVRDRAPVHPVSAPLWEVLIASGFSPGRWALVFRAHHAQMDGGAIITIVDRLFGQGPQPSTHHPGERLGAVLRALPTAAGAVCRGVRTTGSWPAPDAVRPTGALTHAVSEPIDLEVFTPTAATLSQTFAACCAIALNSWSPFPADRQVHAIVPVDLRKQGEQRTVGNHFAPLRLAIPTGEPAQVLGEVVAQMERWRSAAFRRAFEGIRHLIPHVLLAPIGSRVGAGSCYRVLVSSIRSKTPLSYAGSPVTDLVPIALTLPGTALSCVLWTYQRRARIAFCSHTGMPSIEHLPRQWEQALKALSPPPPDPQNAGLLADGSSHRTKLVEQPDRVPR